jgi:hypothetical protein
LPSQPSSPPPATSGERDQPLSLTVHSLPTPVQDNASSAGSQALNRWKLLAIVFICSLPVLVSYFAYFVVRPEGRAAYGELVSPARPMPEATGTDLQGTLVPLATLKKQWLLVSVAGGACPANCARELYLQRQLREMLGKDKSRVDRVWLIPDAAPLPPDLQRQLGDLIVLRVNPETVTNWLGATPQTADPSYFYVVDPLGNTMMRMVANMDSAAAAKARRDLERLLRATASWDEPGR